MLSATRVFQIVLFLLALGLGWPIMPVLAQEPDSGPPTDPVALGAWLYQGQCTRCHGPYEQDRVGFGESGAGLKSAIEGGGCAITWGRKRGGPFKNAEIEALVSYILAWEELGAPPDLPKLPPQPSPTPTLTPTPAGDSGGPLPPPTPTALPTMDPAIQPLVADNPLALGAWLYTHYCYRCHLGYETARMANGITPETVEYTVTNGKSATSMQPFSRQKGGPLKNQEIEAIVLYVTTWEELGHSPNLPAALTAPPTPDPANPITPVVIARPSAADGRGQTPTPLSFARFWPGWPGFLALLTSVTVLISVVAAVVVRHEP